jgi:hypothetical protein
VKGNHDRFGVLLGKATIDNKPGPGEYFRDPHKTVKIIVSGCNFMSETERQPFGNIADNLGPGYYDYKIPAKKKTHIVKFRQKWI